MLGWIGWACRCWQGCIEARIDLCGPWSVVRVLGVPGRNGGVVDRNVEQRRGAVGEGDAVAARRSQCDLVPAISWRAGGPVGDALQVARSIAARTSASSAAVPDRSGGGRSLSSSPEWRIQVVHEPALGSIGVLPLICAARVEAARTSVAPWDACARTAAPAAAAPAICNAARRFISTRPLACICVPHNRTTRARESVYYLAGRSAALRQARVAAGNLGVAATGISTGVRSRAGRAA